MAKRVTQNSVQSPSRSTSRRASQVASLAATTALVAFSPMTAYGAVDVVKGQHQASNPQLNKVTDMQKRIEAAKVPGVVVDRKLQRAIDLAKRAETSNFMVPVSKKQAKFHETVNANHLKINLSKQMEKQVVVDYMLAGVDANIIAKYGSKIEVLGRSDQTWLANMHNMKSMAELAGTLTSNVPVVLSNPGGFWLKSTGLVDVAKLTLLTGQNARNAFGGQFYNFPNKNAPILIEGTIRVSGQTVHEKGLGVFLGASGGVVLGSGSVILAGLKSVKLASGLTSAVVDFANDGLIGFAASERDLEKSLELTGKILGDKTFDGSVVLMSSDEALTTVRGVMTAPSSATKARVESGEIVLTSNAAAVVGGDLRATHGNKGGRIKIEAPAITLSEDAVVDASGLLIGGNVIIGGDFQGSSKTSKEFIIAHPEIQGVERLAQQEDFTIGYENNARHVVVSKGAKVLAKGETQGGRVIVWSGNTSFDHSATVFLGKLDVSSPKGVGGVFEVSSKGRLAKNLTFKDKSGATVQASGSFINKGAEGSAPGIRLFDPAHLVFAADANTAAAVLGDNASGLTVALNAADAGAAGWVAAAIAALNPGGAAAFNLGAGDGDIAAAWASAGGVAVTGTGARAFTFAPSGGAGNVANQSVSWIDSATVQGGDTYVADGWIVVASAISASNGTTGGITFSGNLGIELRANVGNGRNGIVSNVTLTSGAGPIQVAPGTNAQVLVTTTGGGQQGRNKIITLTAATFIGTQAAPVLVGLSAASAASPNIVVSSTGGGDIYLSGYTNNAAGNIKVQSVNTTGAVTLQGNNIYGSNGGDADALQVNSLQNLTGLTLIYNAAKTVDQALVDLTLAAVQTPANLTSIGFGTTGANDLTVADADIDFGARNVSLISGQDILSGGAGSQITTTGNLSLNSAGDIAAVLNPLSVAVTGTLSINSTAAGGVGITSAQALTLGAVTVNNGETTITTTGGDLTVSGAFASTQGDVTLTSAGAILGAGSVTTAAGALTLTSAAGGAIGTLAQPLTVSVTGGNLVATSDDALYVTSGAALSLDLINTVQGTNITGLSVTTTAAITAAAGDLNISTTAGALIVGAGQAISAAAGNVSLKAIGGDLNLTNNTFSIIAAAGGSVFLQGDDIDNWGGGAGDRITGGIANLSMLYNNPKTLGGGGGGSVDPVAALGLVNGGIVANPFNFTFGVVGGALTIGGNIDLTAPLGANTNLILRGDAINDGAGNDFLNANAAFSRTFSNLAALHLQYNQGNVTVAGSNATAANAGNVLLSKINAALAPAAAAGIKIEALGGTLSTVGAIDMRNIDAANTDADRQLTLISEGDLTVAAELKTSATNARALTLEVKNATSHIILNGNIQTFGALITLRTSELTLGHSVLSGAGQVGIHNNFVGEDLVLTGTGTFGTSTILTLSSVGGIAQADAANDLITFTDANGSLLIDNDASAGAVTLNVTNSSGANAPVQLEQITTLGGAVNLTAKNGSGFELTAAVDTTAAGGSLAAAIAAAIAADATLNTNIAVTGAANLGALQVAVTNAPSVPALAALRAFGAFTLTANGNGSITYNNGGGVAFAVNTGDGDISLTAAGTGSVGTLAAPIPVTTTGQVSGGAGGDDGGVNGGFYVTSGAELKLGAIATTGLGPISAATTAGVDIILNGVISGGATTLTSLGTISALGVNVAQINSSGGAVNLTFANDMAFTNFNANAIVTALVGAPGGNLTLTSAMGGAIDLSTTTLSTKGGNNGQGGDITLRTTAGQLTVGNGVLDSSAGVGTANAGANAGSVTISSADDAVTFDAGGALVITAVGGNGTGPLNAGGVGGAVTITSMGAAGAVTFAQNVSVNSTGGAGGDGAPAADGDFTLTSAGAVGSGERLTITKANNYTLTAAGAATLGAITASGVVTATLGNNALGDGFGFNVRGAISGSAVTLTAGNATANNDNGGGIDITGPGSITTTAGHLTLTPGSGFGNGVAGSINAPGAPNSVTVAGGNLVITRANQVALFSTTGVTLGGNFSAPGGFSLTLAAAGTVDLGAFTIDTTGAVGAPGGAIAITSTAGDLTVGNGTLTSTGGAHGGGNGQNAGAVTLTGQAGLVIGGGALTINALGSAAAGVHNGGNGGAVTLSSAAGDVTFTSALTIDSNGGAGGGGGNAGAAGQIDVTSAGDIAGAGLIDIQSPSLLVPHAGGTIDMSFAAGPWGISDLSSMGAVNISSLGDFYVDGNHQTNGGLLNYTATGTLQGVGNGQITTDGGDVSLTAAEIDFTDFDAAPIDTTSAGNGGDVSLTASNITWGQAVTIDTSGNGVLYEAGALTFTSNGTTMTIDGSGGALTYTQTNPGVHSILTVDGAGGEVKFVLEEIADKGVYTAPGNVFKNMTGLDVSIGTAGFTIGQGAGDLQMNEIAQLFANSGPNEMDKLQSIAIRATVGILTVNGAGVNFGPRAVTLQGATNIAGLNPDVLQGGITDLALLFDSGVAWDVHAFVARYIAAVDGAYDSLNSLTIGELGADLQVNGAGVDFSVPSGDARPNKPIALTLRGDDITDENGAALAANSIQGVNALTLQYNQVRSVGVGGGAVDLTVVHAAINGAANAPVTIQTMGGFALTFHAAALDWSAVPRNLTLISGADLAVNQDITLAAGRKLTLQSTGNMTFEANVTAPGGLTIISGGTIARSANNPTLAAADGDVSIKASGLIDFANFGAAAIAAQADGSVSIEGLDIQGLVMDSIQGDIGTLSMLYGAANTLTAAGAGGTLSLANILGYVQNANPNLNNLTVGTTSGVLTLDNNPGGGGAAAAISFSNGGAPMAVTLRGDSIKFVSNDVEQVDTAVGGGVLTPVTTDTNGITLQYNGAQSLGVTNNLDGRLNFLKFKTVLDGAGPDALTIQTMSGDLTLAEDVNLGAVLDGGINIGRNIKLTAAGNLVGDGSTFTTCTGNSLTLVAGGDIGTAVGAFETAVDGQVLTIVSGGASYVQNATALQLGLVDTSGETVIATLAGDIELSQNVTTNDGALTLTSADAITQTPGQTIDTGVGVLTLSADGAQDIGTNAEPITIYKSGGLKVVTNNGNAFVSSLTTVTMNGASLLGTGELTLTAPKVKRELAVGSEGTITAAKLTLQVAADNRGAIFAALNHYNEAVLVGGGADNNQANAIATALADVVNITDVGQIAAINAWIDAAAQLVGAGPGVVPNGAALIGLANQANRNLVVGALMDAYFTQDGPSQTAINAGAVQGEANFIGALRPISVYKGTFLGAGAFTLINNVDLPGLITNVTNSTVQELVVNGTDLVVFQAFDVSAITGAGGTKLNRVSLIGASQIYNTDIANIFNIGAGELVLNGGAGTVGGDSTGTNSKTFAFTTTGNGKVTVAGGTDVWLTSNAAAKVGAINATGAVNVATTGLNSNLAFTDNVAGTNITANSSGALTQTPGPAFTATGDLSLTSTLGNIGVSGNYMAVNVGGSLVVNSAGGAYIASVAALALGAITTNGATSITTAAGDLTVGGVINTNGSALTLTSADTILGDGGNGQITTGGGAVLLVANTHIDFTDFVNAAITTGGGTLGLVSMNGGTFTFDGKQFSTANAVADGGSVALVAMNGNLELVGEGIFDLAGHAAVNNGSMVLVAANVAAGGGQGAIIAGAGGKITASNTQSIGFATQGGVGASGTPILFGAAALIHTFNTEIASYGGGAPAEIIALQAQLTALNAANPVNIDNVGGEFVVETDATDLITGNIMAGGDMGLTSFSNLTQINGTTVSAGASTIDLTAGGAIQNDNGDSFQVSTTGAISIGAAVGNGGVKVENTGAASTTFGVITTSGATTLTSIGNTTFTDAITTRGGNFVAIVPNGSTTAFTKFGGGIIMVSTSAMAVGGNVVFEDTAGTAMPIFGGSVEFATGGPVFDGTVDFRTHASSLNAAGLSLAFSGGATQASISVTTGGTLQVVKTLDASGNPYTTTYGYVAPTPTFTPAAPAVKPAVTPVAPAGSGSGTPSSPSTPGSTPTTPLTPAQVQQTVAQISNLLNQAGVNPSVDQKLISNAESLINNLMSPTGPKGPTGPLLSTADLLGNLANAPTGSLGAGSFGLRPQDDSSNTPVILSASEGPTSSRGLSYSSPQGSTGGTVKSSSPSVVVSVGGSQTITVNQESLTLSLPSLAQQSLSAYVDANGVIQVSPVVQHLMNSFKNNFGVPTIEQSSVLVLPQIIPTLVPGPNGLEIVNQTRGGSTQSVVRSGTFDVTSSMNKAQVISIGSTASSEFYVPGNVPVVAAPQSATHVVLSLSFEEQERIRRAKAAAQAGAPKTEAASQAVVVGSTGGASSSTTSAPTSGGIVIPGNAPASSAAIAVTTTTGPVAITIPAGTSQSAASNSAVVQSAPAAAASGGVVIPGNAPTTATSSGKSVVQTSVEIPSSVAASVASAQASRIISSAATGGFTVGGSAGFAPTPAPSPGDVIIPGNAGVVVIPAKTSAASQASQGASGGGETINIDN